MWRHYVYIHTRPDTGEPFYVGKGTARKRKKSPDFERAYCRDSRNTHWRRVVAKHGLAVEIIAMFKTDAAAQLFEIALILEIGRVDLGSGPLVNLTDGGDGHAGRIFSEAEIKRLSDLARRPRTGAWIASIRRARKNGGNGGVVKHGDKLPPSWVASLARGKLGAKNPWFGKPSPVSKKVINRETGTIYDSIARAAAAEGIAPGALYSYLDGSRHNPTRLARL